MEAAGEPGPLTEVVRAAGGVVVRQTERGPEVLLVHRPRYDDWTFPKGKAEPGESDEQCALREVAEEAGLDCELVRELPSTEYSDSKGRSKRVRYWLMRSEGEPAPTNEVDAVRWASREEADRLLSYARDRPVLEAALSELRVEPDGTDLHRFERLVAEARESEPAAAAESLREALELWRGPPLVEFAYESWAQGEIGRLEELRLSALQDRIDADLALGRHGELVGELERLVADHPLSERLRGQLMLALYRSGRQADALEAYRSARAALVEELGIEPGPELRRLERAILDQDPELDG